MKLKLPLNLEKWLAENREALKPPVSNKCIYAMDDFIVMVVAGPNQRRDFHVDPYEEFFYQIRGDIILKIYQDEKIIDMPIHEGEIFLLPRNIPHSPQRPSNTIGLVIERKRQLSDQDKFQWYCEKCANKLHEVSKVVSDIETDLKDVLFNVDPKKIHCSKCVR